MRIFEKDYQEARFVWKKIEAIQTWRPDKTPSNAPRRKCPWGKTNADLRGTRRKL